MEFLNSHVELTKFSTWVRGNPDNYELKFGTIAYCVVDLFILVSLQYG